MFVCCRYKKVLDDITINILLTECVGDFLNNFNCGENTGLYRIWCRQHLPQYSTSSPYTSRSWWSHCVLWDCHVLSQHRVYVTLYCTYIDDNFRVTLQSNLGNRKSTATNEVVYQTKNNNPNLFAKLLTNTLHMCILRFSLQQLMSIKLPFQNDIANYALLAASAAVTFNFRTFLKLLIVHIYISFIPVTILLVTFLSDGRGTTTLFAIQIKGQNQHTALNRICAYFHGKCSRTFTACKFDFTAISVLKNPNLQDCICTLRKYFWHHT